MSIDDTDLTPGTVALEGELVEEEVVLPGRRSKVDMPDGTILVARVTNRELVLWDKMAAKHRWGKATDSPFMANSFTAWAALRRDGLTTLKWAEWEELECMITDLEDDDDAARPTQSAHKPASS
jgi:hypothetical protein